MFTVAIGDPCLAAVSCEQYPNTKCEFPDVYEGRKKKLCQCDDDKGYTYNASNNLCECTIVGSICM